MLAEALKFLRPDIDFLQGCVLQDDGAGPYIKAWRHPELQPTQAEIEAAALPVSKAGRIAAINAECRARLLARFGDPAEQVSRAIGVYGPAEKSALETGIAATIDASNTASDAVTAAATIEAVEAVTVTWPAI